MPLTDELKDPNSPVRQFIRGHFPDSGAVTRGANTKLAQAAPILPGDRVDWATVGRALDYRLRYYFDITPADKLTAFRGAMWYIRPGSVADRFFAGLDRNVQGMRPVRSRLDEPSEPTLARYCYALALYEELYRQRGASSHSPLFVPQPVTNIDELLAIPSPAAVDDLCALSWAFYDRFSDLISGTQKITLNPEFEGSRDVGGADGDVIVDGCLLDFKATKNPKLEAAWLFQLLGYVLLDYGDRHQIREVGVYMARQQVLLRWPLAELMGLMAGAPIPDLADLRAQFRQIAEGVRATRYTRRALPSQSVANR